MVLSFATGAAGPAVVPALQSFQCADVVDERRAVSVRRCVDDQADGAVINEPPRHEFGNEVRQPRKRLANVPVEEIDHDFLPATGCRRSHPGADRSRFMGGHRQRGAEVKAPLPLRRAGVT